MTDILCRISAEKEILSLNRSNNVIPGKEKTMNREYLQINVYEALLNRFDFLFSEFENIYVSFSGGKDSGLLLIC